MTYVRLLLLTLVLTSCAGSFTGRAPETRTLTRPYESSKVYSIAQKTLVDMGTQITATDGKSVLSGTVHGTVILNIHIQEHGTGTLMTVTGSVPAGKITLGTFTELDEFVRRFTALETVLGRVYVR